MILCQTVKVYATKIVSTKLTFSLFEKVLIHINGGSGGMDSAELEMRKSDSKQFQFILEDDQNKPVDTSAYVIKFLIYEIDLAGNTKTCRVLKTSEQPSQIERESKKPNVFNVYMQMEDTKNINVDGRFMYVVELHKNENSPGRVPERYTVMQGSFTLTDLNA